MDTTTIVWICLIGVLIIWNIILSATANDHGTRLDNQVDARYRLSVRIDKWATLHGDLERDLGIRRDPDYTHKSTFKPTSPVGNAMQRMIHDAEMRALNTLMRTEQKVDSLGAHWDVEYQYRGAEWVPKED